MPKDRYPVEPWRFGLRQRNGFFVNMTWAQPSGLRGALHSLAMLYDIALSGIIARRHTP